MDAEGRAMRSRALFDIWRRSRRLLRFTGSVDLAASPPRCIQPVRRPAAGAGMPCAEFAWTWVSDLASKT